MNNELLVIAGTAAGLGLVHTIIGPDHYLPFIVISKARGWSKLKTMWITFLSGLGHILSSIFIGLIGIAIGATLTKLEYIESLRGDIAAWLLIAFGLAYLAWGFRYAVRHKPHSHPHPHLHLHEVYSSNERDHEEAHTHEHVHDTEHAHPHGEKPQGFNITPWVLFTIFVFGPCEPLIPLVMYPAAKHNILGAMVVAFLFGAVTIAVMMVLVLLGCSGLSFLPMKKMERYAHALAGLAILLCGSAILFLGL